MLQLSSRVKFRLGRNLLFWTLFSAAFLRGAIAHNGWYGVAILMVVYQFAAYGIPAYIHNIWLASPYLIRRKYKPYLIRLVLLLAITLVYSNFLESLVTPYFPPEAEEGLSKSYFSNLFEITFFFLAFTMGQFTAERFESQQQLENLEKEKIKACFYRLKEAYIHLLTEEPWNLEFMYTEALDKLFRATKDPDSIAPNRSIEE